MSTLTPVACANASISFTKASSSDCTKYFQRSIDSLAPGSGFHGADCAQALAQSSRAGPVNAPVAASAVPPFTRARRVTIVMGFLRCSLCVESFSCCCVEQMDEVRIGLEPDAVARFEAVALAEHGDDILAAELGRDLDLRPGRLDHLDLGVGAVVGDGEMLGAHAVDHRTAIAATVRRHERQGDAVGRVEFGAAVEVHGALQEVH